LALFTPVREPPGLPPVRINLFSDTQTRPTPGMKAAMLAAELGDEQHGDDPTVHALCDRMAALLGHAAAMFLPSGTMCNQIAVLTHTSPGDEVLAHASAHLITSEGGGAAALSSVSLLGLPGADGLFDAGAVAAALRPRSRYAPPQTLLAVEQTANLGGGTVWPTAQLAAVAAAAHAAGLATHMDGARLLNAVVASGEPVAAHVAGYDSVWLDFTKGLGAPLGAVLAGSADFIDAAWRWKQRLGGALRQAGMCAAACLFALDHHVDRLAEDHANAARLAAGLARIPGLLVQWPATNLVFFGTTPGALAVEDLAERCRRAGLRFSVMGPNRARACTHLDVDAAGVDEAIDIIRRTLDT
jgi:threonine aldolase